MDQNELPKKIGQAIRTARIRRGLVMRDLAEFAKVSTGAVGNWERGANAIATEHVHAIAEKLRIDPSALIRGNLVYLEDQEPLGDAEIVSDLGPAPTGPMDIEVLGVAVGGDDGDFTLNGEVSGYVRRPPGIAHLRKVFALHVLSDSMVPRYDPGELIYCGGRDAVPGDHVVIETFPTDGQTVGKAYVKKLKTRGKNMIVCEQYNPPLELEFDPYAIKHMWRIIPLRELLGY
ncbi:XRE family transcriptional regulator [Agrobacterium larrymoorei]|uniref:Helix-turn-helix transcriptional regulator n=1 Tax=Agrobacterium larrymoorei TaxID=160699 RepID=A0AAF0H9X3_9HYPH|nr:helix-turn-helix transcriptional regulator [Agrobacterium larrymoorei]WHA42556.1 helix-turn-helix transcriptional regulator [Agrobacterium larrymoorei]